MSLTLSEDIYAVGVARGGHGRVPGSGRLPAGSLVRSVTEGLDRDGVVSRFEASEDGGLTWRCYESRGHLSVSVTPLKTVYLVTAPFVPGADASLQSEHQTLRAAREAADAYHGRGDLVCHDVRIHVVTGGEVVRVQYAGPTR